MSKHSGFELVGDIIPDADNTRDFGSSTKWFANAYIMTVNVDELLPRDPDGTSKVGSSTSPFPSGYIETLYADTINEHTTDSGVTIDGVLLKDDSVKPLGHYINGVTLIKKVVNYDDTFPVTVYEPADGDIISNIFARVTTAFNGDGSLLIGDDNDNDGYATLYTLAANPDVTLNSTGYKLMGHYVKGAYLWNSSNTSPQVKGCTGTSSEAVKVRSTLSGSTQGVIEFYLQVARIG